jgi:hypothetical protein
MGEVIPFHKQPSKPKEEDEMAAFLRLLETISKTVKSK